MLRRIGGVRVENMMDEFDDRRQQIADRFLQSSFGLWNALLTVNGILLAAFSAIYTFSQQVSVPTVLALVAACVLSLVLLVYNFLVTKLTYYRIGQVVADEADELSEEERNRDIRTALFRHKCITYSERACLVLLLVEAGLVVAIVSTIGSHAA